MDNLVKGNKLEGRAKESFFINSISLAKERFHIMDFTPIRFIESFFDLIQSGSK